MGVIPTVSAATWVTAFLVSLAACTRPRLWSVAAPLYLATFTALAVQAARQNWWPVEFLAITYVTFTVIVGVAAIRDARRRRASEPCTSHLPGKSLPEAAADAAITGGCSGRRGVDPSIGRVHAENHIDATVEPGSGGPADVLRAPAGNGGPVQAIGQAAMAADAFGMVASAATKQPDRREGI